jgi:hypothetical protein
MTSKYLDQNLDQFLTIGRAMQTQDAETANYFLRNWWWVYAATFDLGRLTDEQKTKGLTAILRDLKNYTSLEQLAACFNYEPPLFEIVAEWWAALDPDRRASVVSPDVCGHVLRLMELWENREKKHQVVHGDIISWESWKVSSTLVAFVKWAADVAETKATTSKPLLDFLDATLPTPANKLAKLRNFPHRCLSYYYEEDCRPDEDAGMFS